MSATDVAPLQVWAQAYDNPIPGFKTVTTTNLRLWDAVPCSEFDLAAFNAGDYDKVCAAVSQDTGLSRRSHWRFGRCNRAARLWAWQSPNAWPSLGEVDGMQSQEEAEVNQSVHARGLQSASCSTHA